MYRLIKVNICGRVYDCKAENFGGEFWLFHNCGGVDIVADNSEYSGSKRGNYYATKLARKEYDITNADEIGIALINFSSSTYLVEAGEIIDKPQRIRKSNGGSESGTDESAETKEESKPASTSDIPQNIELSETISAELSALGKIGEMLAPSIIAAANIEANQQAKQILSAAIDYAIDQAGNGGGACKIVEYHTARGVYKTDKPEVSHARFNTIAQCVEIGIPVYLYGPAGSGKSYIGMQVAERLSLTYYEDSKIENVFDLKGFIDAGGHYIETAFYKAYTQGGLLFLDELDASAPAALTCINNAIANKGFTFPNGYKEKHPDFRLIAAGNTTGNGAARDKYGIEYVGRNMLDAATLNRFAVKIECDYSEEIEKHITQKYIGERAAGLLEFAHNLRAATAATNVQCTCTYRELTAISQRLAVGETLADIIVTTFGHLDKDDLRLLSANLGGCGAFVEAFKEMAAA